MLESLRKFLSGVSRFFPERLSFKIPELLRFSYSEIPYSNLLLLDGAFKLIWSKKATYSIEIWRDEDFEFYISASKHERLEELARRLSAVYPNPEIEFAKRAFPQAEGYAACGFLRLEGDLPILRTVEDFNHDPLIHVVSAVTNPCMIQFLFRPERSVVETPSGEFPLFRLRIAVACFSENWRDAREECERILRSFSVFSPRLKPVLPSLLRRSSRIFKRIVARKLSLFEGFRVTSSSLAALAHFPLRGDQ